MGVYMKAWVSAWMILLFLTGPAWAEKPADKKNPGKNPAAQSRSAKPAGKAQTPAKPLPSATSARKAVPPPPEKQAPYKAFIVVEAETGRMVEGENVHMPCPPASITKLMLAAIVAQRLDSGQVQLTDPVVTSQEASSMGGSQVFLRPEETFTLDEMMRAVMVASANDAAFAVAEFIAGSREAFVALMNEKAAQLGMSDTRFHSMHGLPPSSGQEPDMSSPHDLALLARELVKNDRILAWTSLKTEPFRDGTLIMRNHNNLMTRFSGMDGLKTGFYRDAGYSIVTTAKRNDLRMIAVVMGSPAARIRDNIAEEKLKNAFARYEIVSVIRKGDPVDREVALPEGRQKNLKPIAATGFSYPVPRDRKKQLVRDLDLPEQVMGEVQMGQRIGEIVIRLEGEVIGRVDLVSPVHVARKSFLQRLFD